MNPWIESDIPASDPHDYQIRGTSKKCIECPDSQWMYFDYRGANGYKDKFKSAWCPKGLAIICMKIEEEEFKV